MKRIVILGECMLELKAQDATTMQRSFAGDTYNTAVYLHRCAPDIAVSYFTATGQDLLSQEFTQSMAKEGLNTDLVFSSPDRTLGLYMIQNDASGERSFSYWRGQSAARQTISLAQDTDIDADYFYFTGISLAILDNQQRKQLFSRLEQMKSRGTRIIFDPNFRPRLWDNRDQARQWTDNGYHMADIAFPGGDDHSQLYGHTHPDDILSHLDGFGIDEIVTKNGAAGVHIVTAGQQLIVPVEYVSSVVDTTAAGDAFNAGYLAARIQGNTPGFSASYGARLASVVIQHPGAIVAPQVLTDAAPVLGSLA